MATYDDASRTKDHFQFDLIEKFPEIVSIAPQLERDEFGLPTENGIIAIGINVELDANVKDRASFLKTAREKFPESLPLIGNDFKERDSRVIVKIHFEGEIQFEKLDEHIRPCPGGYSIGHAEAQTGTLGGVMRNDNGPWEFILSNNHVLADKNLAKIGDTIYQPGPADNFSSPIGTLSRFVPIEVSTPNEVDCAVAIVDPPPEDSVFRNIKFIGIPYSVSEGYPQQHIRKTGRSTELNSGMIESDNATCFMPMPGGQATFENQLQYSPITKGGDSGALIWDLHSQTVVGLHMAGSILGDYSYGNKISRVIEKLNEARTIYYDDGTSVAIESANFALA